MKRLASRRLAFARKQIAFPDRAARKPSEPWETFGSPIHPIAQGITIPPKAIAASGRSHPPHQVLVTSIHLTGAARVDALGAGLSDVGACQPAFASADPRAPLEGAPEFGALKHFIAGKQNHRYNQTY
jgi:hypothetical protein